MTLDKSKKVGRFRRRERGVSHVFAIFFFFRGPNFSTPFSFPRAKFSSRPYFLTYLSPFITFFLLSAIDNQRTNGRKKIKEKIFSTVFERCNTEDEDEARGTPPIYRRRLTIRFGFDTVEWPSSNSKPFSPLPPPPCYRSRHCFHVRTQKLDDAHIIIITDEGGIRNHVPSCVCFCDSRFCCQALRVKIFSRDYYYYFFLNINIHTNNIQYKYDEKSYYIEM